MIKCRYPKHNILDISKALRYVRRAQHQSIFDFARACGQAPLLISLVEHADAEESAPLRDLLPSKDLDDLADSLEQLSSLPFEALLAEAQSGNEPPAGEGEVTLSLPITLNVDNVTELLHQLPLLMAQNAQQQQQCILEGMMLSVGVLLQLLCATMAQQGRKDEVHSCILQFRELLSTLR